jgi:CheY-like chemotaxis protein
MLDGKRIFLIEDDAANLAVTSVILQRAGAIVFFDRWGLETVEKVIKSLPIDIVLLDLSLPRNISGYEVYDQLRQQPQLSTVPVVAVTATDAKEGIPLAQSKGLSGYIPKPVRSGTLPQYVAEILNGHPLWLTPSR